MITLKEYFDEIEAEARTVVLPDHLRARHQVDRQRLEEASQCVCTCGASCPNYVAHLQDVIEHDAYWTRVVAERGHPAEALIRAGINPLATPSTRHPNQPE